MSSESTPEALGDLLRHEPFVRALARNLLDDEHEAEDVVQDTWLAALAQPRQPYQSLRSWLGRVTWNVAADRRRRQQRRSARERDAARSETLPSVSADLERDAAREQIIAVLLGLEEPYRSAVVLRFYHDLPPRVVAERQGIPVETARTRIKRALALLRIRLAADHARDGRSMRHGLALLVHAGERSSSARPALSRGLARPIAAARTRWLGVAAATAAVLAGFWLTRETQARESLDAGLGGVSRARAGTEARTAYRASDGRVPLPRTVETPGAARSEPALDAPAGASLSGRALDAHGNVVAHARLRAWRGWPPHGEPIQETRSDAGGSFLLTGLPESFCVGADTDSLTTLEYLVAETRERAHSGIDLVLGEPVALRGRVLDEQGLPVAGARVLVGNLYGEGDFRATPKRGLYFAPLTEGSTTSSADGAFELITGRGLLLLTAFEPSFAVATEQVRSGDESIELRLERGAEFEVQVFDAADEPVERAALTFKGAGDQIRLAAEQPRDGKGLVRAWSDDAGLCAHPLRLHPREQFFVRADAEGWGSTLLGPFEVGEDRVPRRIELARPRRLEARIRDRSGHPVPGACVTAAFYVDLERAFALGFTPFEDFQVVARAESDPQGRFTLERLPSSALQLWIEPPTGTLHAQKLDLEAGRTKLEIELDSRHSRGAYEGFVVDGSGGPPPERFTVTLLPNGDGRSFGWRREVFAATGGRYSMQGSGAGADVLVFQSPGFATVTMRSSAPAAAARRLDVELHPLRDLSLRIVDTAGRLVPNALLRISDAEGLPLCVAVRPHQDASSFVCGPDGTAHLLSLPARRVRIHAAAHPRGEATAFDFDLTSPLQGVQHLSIAAPDLEHPPARFDLALRRAAGHGPASWRWSDPDAPGSSFCGRVELALADESGLRWWALRGEICDGVFRPDGEPKRSDLVFDVTGKPIDAFRTPARTWGFDLSAEGLARLSKWNGLPRPASTFCLEIVADGAEGFAFTVDPPPEGEDGTLSVALPQSR